MTATPGPEGLPAWFDRSAGVGSTEAAVEEARRWEELQEARERVLRRVRGREGEGRWPLPDPDVAVGFWSPTPVLGFCFWYVFSDCLRGVHQKWIRPEMKAWYAQRGPGAPHAGGGCRCGIYALKAAERLPRPGEVKTRRGATIAYGVVALLGVVVEHEHSYRAARAEAVAVAVQLREFAAGSGDRWWIKRLFQRPDCALKEKEFGVWPRMKYMVPSAEEIFGFLRDEARRFETTWTSASRSE